MSSSENDSGVEYAGGGGGSASSCSSENDSGRDSSGSGSGRSDCSGSGCSGSLVDVSGCGGVSSSVDFSGSSSGSSDSVVDFSGGGGGGGGSLDAKGDEDCANDNRTDAAGRDKDDARATRNLLTIAGGLPPDTDRKGNERETWSTGWSIVLLGCGNI